MRGIVHETWLTAFVDRFGDSALTTIYKEFYSTTFYTFVAWTSVTIALMSLGWAIHNRTFSKRFFYILVALMFSAPYQGKPIGYVIVDSLGRGFSYGLEKGVNAVIANKSRNNMPPGVVMEMIIASATNRLKNEKAKALLYAWVAKCLPNALKSDGSKAVFDDIFNFKSVIVRDPVTGRQVVRYQDKVLDQRALRNDNSFSAFTPNTDCLQGLKLMRDELVKDLSDEPEILTDRIIEGIAKPHEDATVGTSKEWFNSWAANTSKFRKLSMNLRLAHAAEYEKSAIISKTGWDINDPAGTWWQNTGTDASLRELIASMNYTTELGYRWSDLKNIGSNVAGNRWAMSLGAAIKDLKEMIELLPYQLAAIQLLLKLLAPIAIVSLFFQSFRIFTLWAGAWITTLIVPVAISGLRSIGNTIILSKLGIAEFIEQNTPGFLESNKALAYGVDLTIAKNLLNDFVPLAYSLVNQEIDCIKYLTGAMLFAAWFAGGGANGFVNMLSNSVTSTLSNTAVSTALRRGTFGKDNTMIKVGGQNSALGNRPANERLNGSKKAESFMNRISYQGGAATRKLAKGIVGNAYSFKNIMRGKK